MKYSEFHRQIRRAGWVHVRTAGSHYIYEKEGHTSVSVPYHGSKEMFEPMRKRLAREMGL
jgi:mRNA interferase HicA